MSILVALLSMLIIGNLRSCMYHGFLMELRLYVSGPTEGVVARDAAAVLQTPSASSGRTGATLLPQASLLSGSPHRYSSSKIN